MATKKKKLKLKSLSASRPPALKVAQSISSKATRTLIRAHHTLEKQKARALADGNDAKAAGISREIESKGGLSTYQKASLLGQSNDRGGDSSRILMEWLSPIVPALKEQLATGQPVRMLEVGALSITNACSRSRLFEIERIDLNSQAEGIKQQDFMQRPLPTSQKECFDIMSLSLVLNYVPDAVGKGAMLLRTLLFLKSKSSSHVPEYLPSLFLVLPAPCVNNSRYMNEEKLIAIMTALGFVIVKKKLSNKLVYYLWRLESPTTKRGLGFKKEEIRSGSSRNNFAIVLR
ncbi:putative methyltransferase-domain-containing protein [Amylocarpus encephaloides]|uniref:25S rRNA adenine-N(1) methyltransferase n=1 Tax=Amylocarpus encephaloides TaxID=45428 RepID=A0A9P8CA10_9HELO|nr:putative methyltransferase-domain-containing protein [Amylocarpus encephaloides]